MTKTKLTYKDPLTGFPVEVEVDLDNIGKVVPVPIPEPQELHPFWQFLIKLLFIVGTSAAVILVCTICLLFAMYITKGVFQSLQFLYKFCGG